MLELQTSLSKIRGIGPRFLKALGKLKLNTVQDLLRHFPVRYEDFSEIYKIPDLTPGQSATIQAVVKNIRSRRTWQRHMIVVEAMLADDFGTIKAVWFNQPFVMNVLRPGRLANFSGKVALADNELYLSHPAYELIANGKWQRAESETKHTGRLVPVYPETRGLTSKGLRFLIYPILKKLDEVPEWLPEEILKNNNLPEINEALNGIHFPEKIEDALGAQKRFSFEDLFLLQLWNFQQKLKLAREKAPAVKTDIEKLKEIIQELPFELTFSQKRSLWEIIKDLGKPQPMNRLLQGDVGSGKTVVAVLAATVCSRNGYQSAFMAPTEVLARQHFITLKNLFKNIKSINQPTTAILTSGESKIIYENDLEADLPKKELLEKIDSGEIQIVVGTHSLIQKNIKFRKLGLAIIDEQHRFGIKQRAELAKNSAVPHLLSMSATPIPRTLMLTIFGDLNLSIIDELPGGRKPIITKIVSPENRPKAYAFIRSQVKKGRQVFVICPRIETNQRENGDIREISRNDSHKFASMFDIKAVKEEYEKLSQKIFPDLKVAMLHGKMPSKNGRISKGKLTKENAMRNFSGGKTDILVSTSVIEVGVDVPNATIMMIEGAEHFGLAQLYQFRGRVGRGGHQSFCFLFTESNSQSARVRLQAILKAKNGFELAEKDLQLRGPGEFIGEKQTGLPDTAMKALQNPELINSSRAAAEEILRLSPSLKKYPLLKSKLEEFEKKIHPE